MEATIAAVAGHHLSGLTRGLAIRDGVVLGALDRVTPVVGAGIAVIKVHGDAATDEVAPHLLAGFAAGAGVSVVASGTLWLIDHHAAVLIRVGDPISKGVAEDRSNARIVAGRAVLILGHMFTMAVRRVTGVHRADFAVVAGYGLTGAGTIHADIARAGVGGIAGSAGQLHLAAAVGPVAEVLGAIVVVVAKMDEVAALLVRFVHGCITIVVDSVAGFLNCGRGIAVGQPFLGAHALAAAGAEFVLNLAGSPEAPGNGLVGARACAAVGNALFQLNAVNRLHSAAGEACRAGLATRACASTETAFALVSDAGIVRVAHTRAIRSTRAGFAQVRVFGNANEDHVRPPVINLLAGPARGAFLLAVLGADPLPEVLYAPTGLALAVLGAFVEKAALSRVTLPNQLRQDFSQAGDISQVRDHEVRRLKDRISAATTRMIRGGFSVRGDGQIRPSGTCEHE